MYAYKPGHLLRLHSPEPFHFCFVFINKLLQICECLTYRIVASQHGLSEGSFTVEDMFSRQHLHILREAINNMGQSKYCLKLNLNAIIMRTVKSLKGIYAENSQDDKYAELDRFVEAYRFRAPEIFAQARYQATTQTLDKARRPASLPEESDVIKLMNFVKSELTRLTSLPTVTAEEYRLLRALTVCRLTLFNGRRGEEPARMLLSEWPDAQSGEWLRKHEVCKSVVI